MACSYTEAMYLNIGTDICATITATRDTGSSIVKCKVILSEDQKRGQTYYSWNLNAIKARVEGMTDWVTVKPYGDYGSGSAETSFSFDSGSYTAGSRNFTVSFAVFNNAESGTVGAWASVSTSVSWGASAVAPTISAISVTERLENGFTIKAGIDNYGTPSTGTALEFSVMTSIKYDTDNKRYYTTHISALSHSVSVTNNCFGTLNIQSNTDYYYGVKASNSAISQVKIQGQPIPTLPAVPIASNFEAIAGGKAKFDITEASYGSATKVKLQYQYKKSSSSQYSSWTDAGDYDNQQTVTVNLSGLEANTDYDIRVRAVDNYSGGAATTNYKLYSKAFTTIGQPSISISSIKGSYDAAHSPNTAKERLEYIISGVGDASTKYDVSWSIEGVSSDNVISNVGSSGNFEVYLLPSTSYTMTVKTRFAGSSEWGNATSKTFTTPSFLPDAPMVSNVKWHYDENGVRDGITFHATASTPGEGQSFSDFVYCGESYDGYQWFSLQNLQQTYEADTEIFMPLSLFAPYDGAEMNPTSYPKLAIILRQSNSGAADAAETRVVFLNTPKVCGIVVYPNGIKKYISGVKTRFKYTGYDLISSGDYLHPVVIK